MENAHGVNPAPNIAGKTVLDPTNPLSAEMPANGVLKSFLGPNESRMGNLQKQHPVFQNNDWGVRAFKMLR